MLLLLKGWFFGGSFLGDCDEVGACQVAGPL